jgi:acetolactate synthase-1/2/3 large subunit
LVTQIHGGQIVARALKNEGVDAVFTLTGGHIIALLDGCVQEGIRVVDVRHEQSAAHAAEAYTRLTGRLGVAMVTAGPGVTGTITAMATAQQSGSPMLVIGGRHMIRQEMRGGLQEMDHISLVSSVTDWSATVWQVDRLADYVAAAARHAFDGRGGPVFLDIPMDVQMDSVAEDAIVFPTSSRPSSGFGADSSALDEIVAFLQNGERLMIFAGTGPRPGQPNLLPDLADALQAPAYVNSSARGAMPHGHPLLGSRVRSRAMAEADVVLALGVDWDFRTGYGWKISQDATVIQVDADGTKIGWNRPAHVGLVANPMSVVADSIVAVDGGDIVSTTARWLQTSSPGHVLDAGAMGTLGVGPGYAIAAQTVFPDKTVGIVFGDGAFGFNGMEYDTMVRLGLPVIGVLGNDGVWSNIKTFHRMAYPDRLVATDLGVRPYHEVVRGLGGYGEFVEDPDEIRPALERARESGLPSLINVHIAETMRMSSNYSQ